MYLHILLESFLSSLFLPISGQQTFFAMKAFGGFDMRLAALSAFAGGSLAQLVNLGAGRLMLYLKREGYMKLDDAIYARGRRLCGTWLLPLLLLNPFPFGALIAVVFAFFDVPLKRALPILMIGQAGWWAYCAFA